MATRVFVLGDVRLYRELLADRLARDDEYVVVGTAPAAGAALAAIRSAEPQVVLLDVGSPARLDDARLLAGSVPSADVVAVGVAENERDVVACAEAGIAGYVPRDAAAADMLATLAAVRAGELACPPRIAAGLFRRLAVLAAEHAGGAARAGLTRRELEILDLIDQGLSNKEIARRLQIELPTVKNHVHHILEKLHARRRGEAAALAGGRRPAGD